MCVCECACLHTRMHTPICLKKIFLIRVSWNFTRKSKAGTYILKSRPPQTIGATGQWTKGNRLLEIPRPSRIWRCDRTRGPQWSRAWRTLKQKRQEPRSNEWEPKGSRRRQQSKHPQTGGREVLKVKRRSWNRKWGSRSRGRQPCAGPRPAS